MEGFAFLLDAPDGDAATSWVQIAKTGTFKDPRYGEFQITLSDYKKWIKNFEQFALAEGHLGLPVDVDHSPEKRGDTEAVGWVKSLEQRGDEMWAKVEWNEAGVTLVKSRRYAYISPSYHPNFADEKGGTHGTALVGIALTNRPFLQMATVNLSKFTFAAAHKKPPSDNDDDDAGLNADDVTDLAVEGMPYKASQPHPLDDLMLDISDSARQKHAVVVKKVNGETKHMFPIPPGDKVHARAALALLPKSIKAGHITDSEAAAIRARARGVLGVSDNDADDQGRQHSTSGESYIPCRDMELTQVLTALNLTRSDLGVAEDADEATVLSALEQHRAKPAADEDQVVLSKDAFTTLNANATAGAAAAETLRVNRFDTAFDAAQAEGKVVLAQKETFREMYDDTGEKALKLLEGLQPAINMTPGGVGGTGADLDETARSLAGEFRDEVTPMSVDTESLRLHAAAVNLERAKGISYEEALTLAEQGVTS